MTKIDSVDRRIMAILRENGRVSHNEIAGRLDLSESTVRNRIRKLICGDLLKIRGMTNTNMRADKQLLYIMATLTTNKNWERSAEEVAGLPGVRSVSMITGRFDLIIEIHIEPRNLINFLTNQLTSVETIKTSETLEVIKSFGKWI